MSKTSKRFQLFIMVSVLLLAGWTAGSVHASSLVEQTWLPGDDLFNSFAFKTPLPIFGPGYNAALPRVNALLHPFLKVTMKEIDQQVLPAPYGPTPVWAYEISDAFRGTLLGPAHWPGVTVEAQRFFPTTMTYVNELPSFNPLNPTGLGLVQGLVSVDKTIHWANPLNSDCMDTPSSGDCGLPFTGSPPATVHLHGGEVSPGSDGGPDSWFTPDGKTGPGYRTLFNAGLGKAVYLYPNLQEPGTLFFHDHALGATRTNLYSGLAAFYFIRGPLTEPRNLPKGAYEIEMAIQDRQFDTNGQLIFPDGSGGPASNLNGTPPNPTIHPFWIPEFFGDVAIVNGAPWPVLNLEPRRTSSALWMARTRGSTI